MRAKTRSPESSAVKINNSIKPKTDEILMNVCHEIKAIILDDNAERLSELIRKKAIDPNGNYMGETHLMKASLFGKLRCMDVLIGAGACVNATDCYGKTALMNAARYGRLEAVRKLVSAGADINARDFRGRSALDDAKSRSNWEVMDYLRCCTAESS
ncbi:ankyrin repeat domain-containing protein [Candidatus Micrarchaeota archaeon]|nr:ankyrin repeat domain-containing protein [Candidatus Micrarchaeota archaeon]